MSRASSRSTAFKALDRRRQGCRDHQVLRSDVGLAEHPKSGHTVGLDDVQLVEDPHRVEPEAFLEEGAPFLGVGGRRTERNGNRGDSVGSHAASIVRLL